MQGKLRIIYNACRRTWYGADIATFLLRLYSRDPFQKKLKIENHGSVKWRSKEVIGGGNNLYIGKHSLLNRVIIRIRGNNNKILIGDNCKLGKGLMILMFGNNMELKIGNGSTFNIENELLVQEDGSRLIIGNECMFSHHINVRTSDAHPIYDIETGKRINIAKDVHIGNHVWITPNCIIQKGVRIGEGSIVATNSIVTKDIPENCIAAGIPAKVVKVNIKWNRRIKE